MKQNEMIITVTKSMTLTDKTEITETVKTFEMVENNKRSLIKRESSRTEKPIDLLGELFREVA